MRTRLMMVAVVAVLAPSWVGARSQQATRANVAGNWELAVKGPAAHGDMAATMELRQEGKKVTGTFAGHGNEHRLSGEFANGSLTLETTDTDAHHKVSFTAKLKDDGTLAGYLSGPMGDMQWSAKRTSSFQLPVSGFKLHASSFQLAR